MEGPAQKKQINKCRCRDGYRTASLTGSAWQAGSEDCSATLERRSPRGGGSNELLQISQPPSLHRFSSSLYPSVCLFMSFMTLQLFLYAARISTYNTDSHTHTLTFKLPSHTLLQCSDTAVLTQSTMGELSALH